MRFLKRERGASATEYAVLVAVIIVAIYLAVVQFDLATRDTFSFLSGKVHDCVKGANC